MPRKTDSGNPADWLDFAREELLACTVLAEKRLAFRVCRSKLGEALEKALKADLIRRGWDLRRIHDLQSLADDLEAYDADAVRSVRAAVDELADSYTEDRYPGFDLDEEDWDLLISCVAVVNGYIAGLGNPQ